MYEPKVMDEPRYVCPYYSKLGVLPRNRPVDIFIKRKDPFSGRLKVVPEMIYLHDLNRPPIPTHKLLEEDWRATRSFAYTNARMARVERLMEEYATPLAPLQRPADPNETRRREVKAIRCQSCCNSTFKPYRPTKAVFEGPFQDVLQSTPCRMRKHRVGWQQPNKMAVVNGGHHAPYPCHQQQHQHHQHSHPHPQPQNNTTKSHRSRLNPSLAEMNTFPGRRVDARPSVLNAALGKITGGPLNEADETGSSLA